MSVKKIKLDPCFFTSTGYQEDEVKLNSPDEQTLADIWWKVIENNDYYVPSFHTHTGSTPPEQKGLPSLRRKSDELWAPRSVTKLRYRYYFDTRLRDLFQAKVEIRLEAKGNEYKQVIKLGNGATKDQPMMGRPEYPAQLKKFSPALSAIDKQAEQRKETIAFLKETVKNKGRLKPQVRIESQRRKLEYHPNRNRDITVEVGIDLAVAINIAGFSWDIRQLELEVKENDTKIPNSEVLEEETALLLRDYPQLEVETTSKPTPGFVDLDTRKISKKSWGAHPRDMFTVSDQYKKLAA